VPKPPNPDALGCVLMVEREKVEGVVLIYAPTGDYLNNRQCIAYEGHREKLIKWLATEGKDPVELEGYAYDTYYTYANIIDQLHRFVWDEEDHFTLDLDHDHADQYLKQVILNEDYSDSHRHNTMLALKAYFRFNDDEWNPEYKVTQGSSVSQPKDFLTKEERTALREAVLEYGSVPAYAGLSPRKRRKWKRYLARRFGKPMNEVTTEDDGPHKEEPTDADPVTCPNGDPHCAGPNGQDLPCFDCFAIDI